ncbi:MAG TPA: AAA family ATPase [Thermoanaerobaculia bacterium]|nr:AAA family ATPase [Thermoanaerobaculia bacterium]
MEAVLFIGVQGCGKTTFYKERLFETHVRVSRDMLKTKTRERLLIGACLAAKQPFVLDNTNPLASQRAEVIGPAHAAGFRVVAGYFRCGLREALWRNRHRPPGSAIPVPGVIATFKRLEPPSWSEGFDEIRVVSIDDANRFVVREWTQEEGDPPRPE